MAHLKQWSFLEALFIFGVLGLVSGGCSGHKHGHGGSAAGENNAAQNSDATNSDPNAPLGDSTPGLSSHPVVRYKKLRLMRSDFSQALGLAPDQLCAESGHDCFINYQVILGSNDLKLTLYQTQEAPSLSAAVATERLALQACARRVNQDLSGQAMIFKGVNTAAATYTPAMSSAVNSLYQNFLQRQATTQEAQALQDLFAGVLKSTGSATAGRTWANLACWSVATSLESVLY